MSGLHSLNAFHLDFFESLAVTVAPLMSTDQLQASLQHAEKAITKMDGPLNAVIASQMLADMRTDFVVQ